MRVRSAIAPLVVVIVLLAAPASADAPSRTWIVGRDSVRLPAGAACSFPVLVEVGQHFVVTSFAEPIGQGVAAHTTGRIKAEVTNLAIGASVSLDISGPAFLGPDGRPVFGTGQTLLFTDEGLLHAAGRITLDASGDLHLNGRTRDVCAMLAG